jgi:hypothetical protein
MPPPMIATAQLFKPASFYSPMGCCNALHSTTSVFIDRPAHQKWPAPQRGQPASPSARLSSSRKIGRGGLWNWCDAEPPALAGQAALRHDHAGTGRRTVMVCGLVYSSNPSTPFSEPSPDCLCPPNAACGCAAMASLIHTLPVSSCGAMRSAAS